MSKEKKTYYVDCWEQAVRFRTLEVEATNEDEAREIVEDTDVDFEGAEWNTDRVGIEDIWEDKDE